jgi:hypothetical protein
MSLDALIYGRCQLLAALAVHLLTGVYPLILEVYLQMTHAYLTVDEYLVDLLDVDLVWVEGGLAAGASH